MRKIITILCLILLSNSIRAAVVYTDIADVTISGGGSCDIDFNNDGTPEFTLEDMGMGATAEISTMFNPNDVNFVTWSDADDWDAFKPITPQGTIDVNSGFYAKGDCYFNPFWVSAGHEFPIGSDQFIGVRFVSGSETYYAWVGVHLNSDGSLKIMDYAYESVANKAILAGDKGSGSIISSSKFEQMKVYPTIAQHELNISGLPNENCFVLIYSSTGQQILKIETFSEEKLQLNVQALAKGMYSTCLLTTKGRSVSKTFVKL